MRRYWYIFYERFPLPQRQTRSLNRILGFIQPVRRSDRGKPAMARSMHTPRKFAVKARFGKHRHRVRAVTLSHMTGRSSAI
jgi:hypothetical protein